MSDFLASAAEKMGVPEPLVRRSAEARAKASGANIDEVLSAWAGGQAAPAATPAAAPEPAASTPEPAATPAATPAPAASTPEPAAAPAAAPTGVVEPIATPAEVTPEEALAHPVVVTVPTMGIAERTMAALPRWVAVVFVLLPAFGLLYLSGSGSAAVCDDGDVRLDVNVVNGSLVNCDGSAFEGRATGGGGGAQFLAIGEAQYASCAGCHGPNGEGGVGPAFGNINAVFTSCLDHVEWVRLGTNGFREAGRDTYGDLAKPVGGAGVMPGFGALSEEQLASVVAFERIRFGGADPDQTFIDCGLVADPEAEGGESEDPEADAGAEGEAGAPEAARLSHAG